MVNKPLELDGIISKRLECTSSWLTPKVNNSFSKINVAPLNGLLDKAARIVIRHVPFFARTDRQELFYVLFAQLHQLKAEPVQVLELHLWLQGNEQDLERLAHVNLGRIFAQRLDCRGKGVTNRIDLKDPANRSRIIGARRISKDVKVHGTLLARKALKDGKELLAVAVGKKDTHFLVQRVHPLGHRVCGSDVLEDSREAHTPADHGAKQILFFV